MFITPLQMLILIWLVGLSVCDSAPLSNSELPIVEEDGNHQLYKAARMFHKSISLLKSFSDNSTLTLKCSESNSSTSGTQLNSWFLCAFLLLNLLGFTGGGVLLYRYRSDCGLKLDLEGYNDESPGGIRKNSSTSRTS